MSTKIPITVAISGACPVGKATIMHLLASQLRVHDIENEIVPLDSPDAPEKLSAKILATVAKRARFVVHGEEAIDEQPVSICSKTPFWVALPASLREFALRVLAQP